jgi:hypothetical protein
VDVYSHQADLLPLVTLQPPVRLPPADDLAALVRATPLVHTLLRLAEWTAGGRPTVGDDEVREAVSAFGLLDTAEFERLWRASVDSGLIDVQDGTAAPGAEVGRLVGGRGEEVLEIWGDLLYSLFSPEADPATLDAGTSTLLMLLSQRVPLSVEDIPELHEEVEDELIRLRLIERDGLYVHLAPLGLWTAIDLFRALIGQDIPIFGATAGADAQTLLRALRSYDDDERAEEVRVWLGDRDPGQAAREIADVLLDVSPLSRAVGLTVLLEELGPAGFEVAAGLRRTPRVGALIVAREPEDPGFPPAVEDVAWVYADMTVAAMEIGGPPEGILELSGNMSIDDVLGMLTLMVHSDHPYTEPLLRFLIENHPEPRIGPAARAALQRWQGHQPGAPGARGRRPKKPRKSGARKKRRN